MPKSPAIVGARSIGCVRAVTRRPAWSTVRPARSGAAGGPAPRAAAPGNRPLRARRAEIRGRPVTIQTASSQPRFAQLSASCRARRAWRPPRHRFAEAGRMIASSSGSIRGRQRGRSTVRWSSSSSFVVGGTERRPQRRFGQQPRRAPRLRYRTQSRARSAWSAQLVDCVSTDAAGVHRGRSPPAGPSVLESLRTSRPVRQVDCRVGTSAKCQSKTTPRGRQTGRASASPPIRTRRGRGRPAAGRRCSAPRRRASSPRWSVRRGVSIRSCNRRSNSGRPPAVPSDGE